MAMTETWASQQLEWLGAIDKAQCLRSKPSEATRYSPASPNTTQTALVETFRNVLDSTVTPKDAATQLSSTILSSTDITTAYSNMLGILLKGAHQLSSHQHLQNLADLAVELAALPDAVNTQSSPMTFSDGYASVVIRPGKVLELLGGDRLWSNLVSFGRSLGYYMRGPEGFLKDINPEASAEDAAREKAATGKQAEEHWTNINTFCALVARRGPLSEPSLSSCLRHSLETIVLALEYSPETREGSLTRLRVRAAATWIVIAKQDVREAGSKGLTYMPGDLWAAAGGTREVSPERWSFWQRRFQELAEMGDLRDDAADLAREAAAQMA